MQDEWEELSKGLGDQPVKVAVTWTLELNVEGLSAMRFCPFGSKREALYQQKRKQEYDSLYRVTSDQTQCFDGTRASAYTLQVRVWVACLNSWLMSHEAKIKGLNSL